MDELPFDDIIYNVSWEDGECDLIEYGIDEGSAVCMITTGGDNVLVYLAKSVESIHTFDINPYQNYLLEMKMAIISACDRETAVRLLGTSDSYTEFMRLYATLRSHLRTEGARLYWDDPANQAKFRDWFGCTWPLRVLRTVGTVFHRVIKKVGMIPLPNCLANAVARVAARYQGVPSRQHEMYRGHAKEYAEQSHRHGDQDSYFYTGYFKGQWDESSLPLYLQAEWYETVRARLSRVHIVTGSVYDMVGQHHPPAGFTHVNLLDSMDWMEDKEIAEQARLLQAYCRPGARLCYRSAYDRQPFACLANQTIRSKCIWTDGDAHPDRVGTYRTVHVMQYNEARPIVPAEDVQYTRDIWRDVSTLASMVVPRLPVGDHTAWLDRFYGDQVDYYDNYRSRMLHGKRLLMGMVPYFSGMTMLLFAGGTADVLRYVPRLLYTATCMDLCGPMLAVARRRYPAVHCVLANAEDFVAAEPVDFVVCSYSLTMIPNWQRAIQNMVDSCRPGGYLCCTDFTVRGENIVADAFTRSMFEMDRVRLDPAHLATLNTHPQLERVRCYISEGGFPLTPGCLQASYYCGVWKKTA
jgi:S-adenosylmethionine-diacylgycerolhomoserine-N-methlytransferase